MLRQAHDYWVAGRTLRPNLPRYGWGTPELGGCKLPNLHFALADAAALPFADRSLDVVFNAFLLDRLPAPLGVFAEWRRVIRPGGRLVLVTPLNFLQPAGWREAYPPVRIVDALVRSGWSVMDWTDPLELFEPLDARGNGMRWRCVAGVFAAG